MIRKFQIIISFLFTLVIISGCKENTTDPAANEEENDILSGGETTTFITGSLAYSTPAANLSQQSLEKHFKGDVQFESNFVKSPAVINPGLGPLFNNNSCINCHVGDGRGRPPLPGEQLESMLLRISIAGKDEHNGPNPVPGFGGQLQVKSVLGYEPEGRVDISYREIKGNYPDGTSYILRKPVYTISGRVGGGILFSPRVAPPVFGSGLLEAISEANILSKADESDLNKDGISGKPNYTWNYSTERFELGRFGWKANSPTLLQQAAAAYNNDMGITSPYFKMENCYKSSACDTSEDDPEISLDILIAVEFYLQTLAVPSRRDYNDAVVKKGKLLFKDTGCNSCHVSEYKTSTHKVAELSSQVIHPYTDLLLHDMGDELSDNRPDYDASGNEWRTPPLWGIGLLEIINGYAFFLHDGRARSLEEAILWHGGEGSKSREKFMNLNKEDRYALIKFLKSL